MIAYVWPLAFSQIFLLQVNTPLQLSLPLPSSLCNLSNPARTTLMPSRKAIKLTVTSPVLWLRCPIIIWTRHKRNFLIGWAMRGPAIWMQDRWSGMMMLIFLVFPWLWCTTLTKEINHLDLGLSFTRPLPHSLYAWLPTLCFLSIFWKLAALVLSFPLLSSSLGFPCGFSCAGSAVLMTSRAVRGWRICVYSCAVEFQNFQRRLCSILVCYLYLRRFSTC